MTQSLFTHLHLHSEYSLVDGIVRIKPLINAVAAMGMSAVAITDQSNLFAAVKFYQAAISQGIKPIIGADIYLENELDEKNPYRLVLLCQNQRGFLNLTRLISQAYTEGQTNTHAVVKKAWLRDQTDGLIALSAGLESELGHVSTIDNPELVKQVVEFYQHLFPDRFYIELHRTGRSQEEVYNKQAIVIAQQFKLPVVASNDVRFLKADDFSAHEARVCIHDGQILSDPKRVRRYSSEQNLKSPEQMAELFADIPEALQNSVEIAKRCNLQLQLGQSYLPIFPLPENSTVECYLSEKARQSLEQRLVHLFDKDADEFNENCELYQKRLKMELDVINSMGFPGYFLIVADFIQWAKDHNIPVGPGRGSGAGSLVAYALGITDLDPLQYDLLFERFLNPERVSMPDFDIDFCMDNRDRVIDYVANRYGRECVSQIITFGTMAAKAVVRDVGRVLGHPYGYVDKLAKLIPFELGITLEKALQQELALQRCYHHEEEVKHLFDLAMKLEGIVRNAGKHAGGVVIAPALLTDFVPLYCEPSGENLVTQFDKDDVEKIGLVKFDFLGLRTLTIIQWAVDIINDGSNSQGKEHLSISQIPMEDEKTFTLLKACQTTAVFQLESRGMKDLIKRLQPDCFEEIVALVALFRPGPLQSGMVDDFIDRKHGRAEVVYPHPDLEAILKPTYGVILYQEQVMQIAQVLAGYSLGQADLLRRAMGKKKPEAMAKHRAIFLAGASQRGVSEQVASHIFDLMEKFAGYGFNKSHSAAYALVAYQTAWLKAHYPAEFMAAVLSSDMDNTDKLVGLLIECRQLGITILPPDINQSYYRFIVIEASEIRYGLGAIKGVGENAIESIITNRKKLGPYQDIFSFCQRIDLRKANKRVLSALIRSGSLDCFAQTRSTLMANLPNVMRYAEQFAKAEACGQKDLFGGQMTDNQRPHMQLINQDEWHQQQRLAGEKETLGTYLSGHPFHCYQVELANWLTAARLDQFKLRSQEKVNVGGIIVAIRRIVSQRGHKMAFITLDDSFGRVEVGVFSKIYEKYAESLQKGQILLVEGMGSIDEYNGGYRIAADNLYTIEQFRFTYAKKLRLNINHSQLNEQTIQQLASTIQPFRHGNCCICLNLEANQHNADVQFGADWQVCPSDELLQQLKTILGNEQVSLVY